MNAINAWYTKKVERYSQTKFGYWPRSNLRKTPFNKKQPFAKC